MSPRYHILYVDDEPALLDITRIFLENGGVFSVDCALSGSEALTLIAAGKYDAVVSDYQMPGMDGITLLKLVRETYNNLPFILFTGKGREDVVIEAINCGVDFYLQKGGEPKSQYAELSHKIHTAIARHTSELALKESEEQYRNLVETTGTGYVIVDRDGRVMTANDEYLRLTGRSSFAEIEGRPVTDWTAPYDLERNAREIEHIFGTGQVRGLEIDYQRPDGTFQPVEINASVVSSGSGQIILTLCRDIAERKRTERDLAKKGEELNASYDQLTSSHEILRQTVDELSRSEQALKASEERVRQKLESLLSPTADIGKLELVDIIDTSAIQSMMDDFYAITHIGIGIIDLKGKVLVGTGWQTICTAFHRSNPRTCAHCLESDTMLTKGVSPGTIREYKCKNNMWDIVTPIIVGGNHVGNLFLGQFLYDDETPDIELFRAQAVRYGFDEQAYLAALEQVPRWSRETVGTVMTFYTKFAWMISTLSFSNITLARTVNERDRLLHSLQESESTYRMLVENIPDKIFIKDASLTYVSCNQDYGRDLGIAADAIAGKTDYDFYPRDLAEKYRADDRAVMESGTTLTVEERYTAKGKESWIFTSKTPIWDEEGNVTGILGIFHDITERKRIQEALLESERKYRNLYRYAQVGLFETSLKDGTVVACNERYATLAGYLSVEEAIGKDIVHLYENPDDRREVIRILREQGHIDDHIVQFKKHLTGRPFWAQFSARINRETDVAEGTIVDITEQKQTEFELAKKTEELMASYEQLTASEEELKSQFDALVDTERTLRINEERLLMAQDISHSGCWEYHVVTDTIWESAEGLRIFGFPPVPADLSLNTIEACILEREQVHQALVDLICEGKEYNIEYSINPADGSPPRVVHSIARLELDAQGKPYRVLGVIQDITERKQTELKLKDTLIEAERFREALDHVSAYIYMKDLQDRYVYANRPTLKLFGCSAGELVGLDDTRFFPPETVKRLQEVDSHVFAGEQMTGEIEVADAVSGRRVYWEVKTPIFADTERKTVSGLLGISTDITEHKRAEEALRESEERFRAIFDASFQFIGLMKTDGTLIEINQSALDYAGITLDMVINKPFWESHWWQGNEMRILDLKDAIARTATGQFVRYEVELQGAGETRGLFDFSIKPVFDQNGTVVLLVPEGRDISSRKMAEDALVRVNRKLNIFNDLTRKDLTNQVFVLRSYLELEKHAAVGQDNLLKNLEKMGQVLQSINDITEFTRDYQNMGEFPPTWQNVKLAMLYGISHISPGGIHHSLETENLEIFADPLLEKAFQGLFENAVAHGGQESLIHVWYREDPEGGVIVFEYDGAGIPVDRKEQIFLRGEGTRSQVRGLFFIREILDLTGITIQETGDPDRGVRFEITVPRGAYRIARIP